MKKINIYIMIILIMITFTTFLGYSNVSSIHITDGEFEIDAKVYLTNIETILNKLDIEVNEGDIVVPSINEKPLKNSTIVIHRARIITIDNNGQITQIKSAKENVSDILKEADIVIDEHTTVTPNVDNVIGSDRNIKLISSNIETITKEIKYSKPIIYVSSDKLNSGETKLIQEGIDGQVINSYLTTSIYKNSVEYFVNEQVIKEPVAKKIEIGIPKYLVFSDGSYYKYSKSYTMTATAYDLSYESTGKNPGDYGFGRTAAGTTVRPGVAAVDTKLIPFHSNLYIVTNDRSTDYGFAKAEDRGGSVNGKKIDLFMSSRSKALTFGRRTVTVYVLEEKITEDMMNKTGGNFN
jgi:uncharacterized protein YabE (DUF348 family)